MSVTAITGGDRSALIPVTPKKGVQFWSVQLRSFVQITAKIEYPGIHTEHIYCVKCVCLSCCTVSLFFCRNLVNNSLETLTVEDIKAFTEVTLL